MNESSPGIVLGVALLRARRPPSDRNQIYANLPVARQKVSVCEPSEHGTSLYRQTTKCMVGFTSGPTFIPASFMIMNYNRVTRSTSLKMITLNEMVTRCAVKPAHIMKRNLKLHLPFKDPFCMLSLEYSAPVNNGLTLEKGIMLDMVYRKTSHRFAFCQHATLCSSFRISIPPEGWLAYT
ncbi:hypothetical protein BDR04DRAFT_90744 [Suillus decipiens]|nr:hypothetical protein BDR04DRAFT_90744 [Suillus decipiens]